MRTRFVPIILISKFAAIAVGLSSASGQVPSIAPPAAAPPAGAPETGAKTPELPAPAAQALTKEDVQAWLDGFMPYALQRGDIAGAVVAVVKDGQVMLSKGYGYADVAGRKPVDPASTLFRAGSVSKLFTWTAVMQMVEQGKIDLDADINTYLDLKIPERNGKPITMRNLMTHTPGFDENARALITSDPKEFLPLDQALKHWIPPRVTDAGSTPAYSNYGAALAGYIVQRLSGLSFDDYIEQKIFAPLGMTHGTFRQPLPERLQADMSKGYKLGSGDPKPFEIISVPPAGSLSISGSDMARFMIAHLQNGQFESGRILKEETAVKMHSTAAEGIAPLNQMLLGFYQNNINGRRVITHAGDTEWFHSELNLLPDNGVGLYLSVNSQGKEGAAGPLRTMLFQQFMERYFPGPLAEGKVDAETAKAHARLMTGRYTLSRRAHTSFLSMLNLLGEIQVAPNKDGTITVTALKGADGQPKKWQEIAPFVWRNAAGGDRLAAKVDNGKVVRFAYDEYPFMMFEPVPWWWSSGWLLPLWLMSLVALALTTLAWPVSAIVRRRYGAAYELTGKEAKAHRLVRIASLLVVGIMLAWVFVVSLIAADLNWAGAKMDVWLILLRVATFVILVGGAALGCWYAGTVLASKRRRWAKVWSVVLAVAFLVALYVGVVFHLVGYTANY
ncbi:MAG: serine hydrolase [Chthoniobacterales bacterium]|nr:MAG: serine hydrolase [Chthoniobacterales bacterium]